MFGWGEVFGAADLFFRAKDALEHRGAPLNSDDFVKFYAAAVRSAINVLPLVPALAPERLQEGTVALLRNINTVVHAYHSASDKITIETNYMIPFAPTDDLVRAARFCDTDRRADSFAAFLLLQRWSREDPSLPLNVTLPVERGQRLDQCLPGAPKAFTGRAVEIVADTQDWRFFQECHHDQLREQMAAYFRSHKASMRSFVSLPVFAPEVEERESDPIAVVNVQSSATNVFGAFAGNQRKLKLLMQPLLGVLAYYLERLHPRAAAQPTQPADLGPN